LAGGIALDLRNLDRRVARADADRSGLDVEARAWPPVAVTPLRLASMVRRLGAAHLVDIEEPVATAPMITTTARMRTRRTARMCLLLEGFGKEG
jgi:hypothetical protein